MDPRENRTHRKEPRHSVEPGDPVAFTRKHDRFYTAFADIYDVAVRHLPLWKTWLSRALPHVEGPRVLEVSFGTGYLLSRCAGRVEAHGADLNRRMVETTRRNLSRAGLAAALVQANVERLPYRDGCFDTLVNTMAFSGYPDGRRALSELNRVLRPGGKLILIDVGYPRDRNRLGTLLAAGWKLAGDILRDTHALLEQSGFEIREEEIGGRGSVHLYVATKPAAPGLASAGASGSARTTQ